ncbi:MAG: HAMP domain-containing protein [Deltaproteobacteria bacterium]|nr:HAMP domain-containing protein [Deltaproteobacteria bacterium]
MKFGFNRRKRYFINKRIQLKYIILTVSLLVIYTVILLGAIFAPYALALFTNVPLPQKAEAAQVLLLLHSKIWPGVGLIILLFGIATIYITHKIAGPVYIFERMAKEIADGNLTIRVKLRKGDDLQDLGEDLNKMTDNLESLLIILNKEYERLSLYISNLKKELESKQISEQAIIELVKNIEGDKDSIGDILDRYIFKGKSLA